MSDKKVLLYYSRLAVSWHAVRIIESNKMSMIYHQALIVILSLQTPFSIIRDKILVPTNHLI